MERIYEALGWQGGTIHQVIDEIKRLKTVVDLSCDNCIHSATKNQVGTWECNDCIRNFHPDRYIKRI